MKPFMYVIQGTIWEEPQRTHRWNNHHYRLSDHDIDFSGSFQCPGHSSLCAGWQDKLTMHLPVLGGRRYYRVLAPAKIAGSATGQWFVGWCWADRLGISRLPLTTPVRVTIGPEPVTFLGFTGHGETLPIRCLGTGQIGLAGDAHAQLPLR